MRDVPWEDIFELSTSAAVSEFFEWIQVGIDVCIPHCKYQVNPHSSPWFSGAFAAAIVHRNYFFLLNLKESSEKENLHMLIKRKVHHFPEIWLSVDLANC